MTVRFNSKIKEKWQDSSRKLYYHRRSYDPQTRSPSPSNRRPRRHHEDYYYKNVNYGEYQYDSDEARIYQADDENAEEAGDVKSEDEQDKDEQGIY